MANLRDNPYPHLSPKDYQSYLTKKSSGDFVTATDASNDQQLFWDNNHRTSIGEYDNDHSATKDE